VPAPDGKGSRHIVLIGAVLLMVIGCAIGVAAVLASRKGASVAAPPAEPSVVRQESPATVPAEQPEPPRAVAPKAKPKARPDAPRPEQPQPAGQVLARQIGSSGNLGASVTQLALSPDGRYVLCSAASTLCLLDLANFQRVRTLVSPVSIEGLTFLADGRRVVIGGPDGVHVCDLQTGTPQGWLRDGEYSLATHLTISADNSLVLACDRSSGRIVRLWNLTTNQLVNKWTLADVNCLAFTPDGHSALTGGNDGKLHLYDLATGQAIRSWKADRAPLTAVAISANGTRAFSTSQDRVLAEWEIPGGKPVHSYQVLGGTVSLMSASQDGRLVLCASTPMPSVVDMTNGQEICRVPHSGVVTGVALLPDGKHAVTGGYDQTVRVWEIPR